MKYTVRRTIFLLVAPLLAALLFGCQSSVRMTRPDTQASLDRPESWPREIDAEQSGTLFQIRHPVEPVRVRLSRLDQPIIAQAHDAWARLWLEESFDEVTAEESRDSSIGSHQALLIRSRAVDAGEELTHELFLANAGAETFVLEAWGHSEAMSQTDIARKEIAASLQLPSGPSTDAPSPAEPVELAEAGVRLVLPETPEAGVRAKWQVDRRSPERIVFKLPSHLIEGEVLVEQLDYPIDAATYAKTALGTEIEGDIGERDDVRLWEVLEDVHPVDMRTSRRFLTKGERAVQVAVSTPVPLYATNSEIIEALIESLEIDEDAE